MTGMKLTVRIWEETKQAMRAVPALRQVPQVWVRHVEAEGGSRDDAFRFWAVCHERRMSCVRRATVREMKECPSSSVIRSRSQATASCCGQKPWWCCVKKVRERHAVREMKEDPSEPSCRGRLQTAMSCFGQKLR